MTTISFCTTCMGRLHHLKQTLPENLEAARRFGPGVELVVLNYNSPDALDDWMHDHMAAAVRDGIVRYLVTREPTHFHPAHAKNVAHRAARGEIVFNLDADNMIEHWQIRAIVELFASRPGVIVSGGGGVSTGGRVGLRRTDFFRLRGYAEQFRGFGVEDHEFLLRARARLGLTPLVLDGPVRFIEHGDHERTQFLEDPGGEPPSGETMASLSPTAYQYFSELRARSPVLAERWGRNRQVLAELTRRAEVAVNGEDWGRVALEEPAF